MKKKPNLEMYEFFFVFKKISDNDATAWNDLESWIEKSRGIPVRLKPQHKFISFYNILHFSLIGVLRHRSWGEWHDEGLDSAHLGPVCKSVWTLRVPFEEAARAGYWAARVSRHMSITLFERSSKRIYRTDGFNKMTMRLEHKPNFESPTLNQICDAVDTMTPDGGPSIIVLKDGDKEETYAQAAGGLEKFTCEWRETSDGVYKHWVAGTPAKGRRDVKIRTNGHHLIVKANERLCAADVKSILAAFARRESRPQNWVWRDISNEIPKNSNGMLSFSTDHDGAVT